MVDAQRPAGELLVPAEDALEVALGADGPEHAGGRDRAGVDHGVQRSARCTIQRDRVERIAGRLDTDLRPDGSFPVIVKDQRVRQRFRDRLDRERDVGITDGMDRAVERCRRDPEP